MNRRLPTNTVLLGEIEELKKKMSDAEHRFELKEAHYRAQLESQKRESSIYFQIAQGVVPTLKEEVYTDISPFKKRKANTVL